MKEKLGNRKIIDIFENLGVEELWQQNSVVNNNEYHWHMQDFLPGGKMEAFAGYSLYRFEEEFSCVLWLG